MSAAETYYSYMRYKYTKDGLLPPALEAVAGVAKLKYGCISMQRYWSPLRYSFLRTLFLLAADLRRHHPRSHLAELGLRINGLSVKG